MTEYAFPVAPRPTVSIAASNACFPLRRVYCVGRNYAAHAREMGADPQREDPFFFAKPADAVVCLGTVATTGGLVDSFDEEICYPRDTNDLHHEVELVVALGRGGEQLSTAQALDIVYGYAVGNDLTRRDLQSVAKEQRRPWDLAKGFDGSALCSPIVPTAEGGHPTSGRIWLEVNGQVRQEGDLEQLIWSVPELIAKLSHSVKLAAGDLIYTGTPAGVGPLQVGDRVSSGVAGVGQQRFTVSPRAEP